MHKYQKSQRYADYYRLKVMRPKFLAINKVWENDKGLELLVNTDYNQFYLLRLEPGNYNVEFGQIYGCGDIIARNLTGTVLCTSLIDQLNKSAPGLISYKCRKKTWSTFGNLEQNKMAVWLDRGSYNPSHVFYKEGEDDRIWYKEFYNGRQSNYWEQKPVPVTDRTRYGIDGSLVKSGL